MGDVVSLKAFRKNKKKEESYRAPDVEENLSFEQIAERNKKNEERLKRERAKNNKDVTRSHRLKR